MSGISSKYNIKDAETAKALGEIMAKAEAGVSGNYELMNRGITRDDAGRMKEGKRYIDAANKRTVFKIGNELYFSELTKLTPNIQGGGTDGVFVGDDMIELSGNPFYLAGNEDTDGSWKIYATLSGDAVIQKRISGVWTTIGTWQE